MNDLITLPGARYLVLLAVSALTTIALMPLALILGRRMNAWDTPDDLSHTNHTGRIVRTGGIAITGGIYAGIVIAMVIRPDVFATRGMAASMIGGSAIFVVGLLDDLREIKPWLKAVLLLAACLGTALLLPAVKLTGFERLDFLLSVLILMGGINAFNLMDGMDGLAAGMAIAASLGLLVLSLRLHTFTGGCVKVVVIGAALCFLYFNRPPAKIFMGDCGSLVLGFYLARMGLNVAGSGPAAIVPVLLVLSPFVLDTGLAIARRIVLHKDIFTGDRRHVYDLLHHRSASVWTVDAVMWGLGLGFAGLGFAATFMPVQAAVAALAASWLAFILWMARLGMFVPISKDDERLGNKEDGKQ